MIILDRPRIVKFLCLGIYLCLAGCASTTGGWGSKSTITPGWERISKAAKKAATSKQTWVPLVGAALFSIDDFDEKTQKWITEKTLLFGNDQDAQDFSDDLKDLAKLNLLATIFFVPTSNDDKFSKLKGLAASAVAISVNRDVTNFIKRETSRLRPDGSDRESFPSGHTSSASTAASLSHHVIDHMSQLTPRQRKFWQASSFTVAGLTGWARIEGNKHHPSDVLAGYALGNFVGTFIGEAFIGSTDELNCQVSVSVLPGKQWFISFNSSW
jgi:membrane-associated phospholipid phosphatase